MTQSNFSTWFRDLSGHSAPREWQTDLASREDPASRFIRIPTGLGKTEGVLGVWTYYRLRMGNQKWPRRLIWCLPMRVLVEQTFQTATSIAEAVNRSMGNKDLLTVHQAMGGEEIGDWFLFPERPAIIVGTQDMLLSRALNRGYGSSRARWPIEFGLLNRDSLWVMDEVQLMDVGLATSAQVQAFRDHENDKSSFPCHTWWMSATLQPEWLLSVDTEKSMTCWQQVPCVVSDSSRTAGLFDITKEIQLESIDAKDSKSFAALIFKEHTNLERGEHGRITLVVCNTVKRALETYNQLITKVKDTQVELVHSRFRPVDREKWREQFLSKESCSANADRIIVSTQVVEAGVDISAGCLITELSPWPSLVQRFGRCARYGGSGRVVVVDRGHDAKSSLPYTEEQLVAALEAIQQLQDVGIASLERFEKSLSKSQRERLYPYSPEHLLLRSEFDELFDTTADLTGADIDISRFIRSGEERDLQVFWLNVRDGESPPSERQAQRDELCSVKFLDARDWLCGEETKSAGKPYLTSRMQNRAWVWDWIDGAWVVAKRADLLPGRIVCVASDRGGYSSSRGFDPTSTSPVSEVEYKSESKILRAANDADNEQDNERLSYFGWKSIAFHSQEVEQLIHEIDASLGIDQDIKRVLLLAARWHDIGKAHPAFQIMLRCSTESPVRDGIVLAKSGNHAKGRPRYFADLSRKDERVGFRHELASALALFAVLEKYQPDHPALLGPWLDWFREENKMEQEAMSNTRDNNPLNKAIALPASVERLLEISADDFDFLVYLVASHHGKVRVALHASPSDQEYLDEQRDGRGLPIRGVRDGDTLLPIQLDLESEQIPSLSLSLEPAALGLSQKTGRSWRERTNDVINRFGPTQLAFWESVLRAADVRASKLSTIDPLFESQVSK